MAFEMRTSKPKAGNKFYNNGNNGGYSWCINGYPMDKGCNVLSNCVGYACGRFNEIGGTMKYKTLCCNAENFIEAAKKAGLEVGMTPKVGAIMCWQKGATLSGKDGAGHVEVVENVYDNNHVYTSGSSWGGAAFFNAHRYNTNGSWGMNGYKFRGFIYNPAVKETVKKKDIDAIAKEVIAGKWGNGADRKRRLTEAGYNFSTVQAKVNELLYGKKPVSKLKSTDTIAREVIAGKWGNGLERKKRLTAAGYNFSTIQARVNKLLNM